MCNFFALWIEVQQEFNLCHFKYLQLVCNAHCLHKNLESHEEDIVTHNEALVNDDTTKPHLSHHCLRSHDATADNDCLSCHIARSFYHDCNIKSYHYFGGRDSSNNNFTSTLVRLNLNKFVVSLFWHSSLTW